MAIFNTSTNYYLQSKSKPTLYLNRYGTGTPANQQNVNAYPAAGTSDQRWRFIHKGGSTYQIALEMNNYVYGLDYYWGSTNKYNCDINTLANNAADSTITVYEIEAGKGNFFLKFMIQGRYLTVNSNNDVRWEPDLGTYADAQLWSPLTSQGSGGSTTPTGEIGVNGKPISGTGNARLVNQQLDIINTSGTPLITVKNIPDRLAGGVETTCLFHKASGFENNTDFTVNPFKDNTRGAIANKIRKFVQEVYKTNAPTTILEQDILYYIYGESYSSTGNSWFHTGVDMKFGSGSPIYSHRAGTLLLVNRGAGAVFIKDSVYDVTHIYVHMSMSDAFYNNLNSKVNTTLGKGTLIGYQGNVGNTAGTGEHLHYEVQPGSSKDISKSFPTASTKLPSLIPYFYMGL